MSLTLFKPLWIASAALLLGSQPSDAQTQVGLAGAGDATTIKAVSSALPFATESLPAALPDKLTSCPRGLFALPRPCNVSGSAAAPPTGADRRDARRSTRPLRSVGTTSVESGDSVPPDLPSPPFWNARKAAIVSGVSAAIGAAAISWSSEMNLRDRRLALTALPPGAVDQWNQQFADAKAVQNTRDFWRNVSLGVGGVTLGYWAVSGSSSHSGRITLGADQPGNHGWRVRLNPFHPEISVSRSLP